MQSILKRITCTLRVHVTFSLDCCDCFCRFKHPNYTPPQEYCCFWLEIISDLKNFAIEFTNELRNKTIFSHSTLEKIQIQNMNFTWYYLSYFTWIRIFSISLKQPRLVQHWHLNQDCIQKLNLFTFVFTLRFQVNFPVKLMRYFK